MSHDEKSQAQQDKESHVKEVEDKLKGEYDKAFKEHQSAAEKARGEQPDNVETEEEYRERIANVPGLFSDSYAYGVSEEKTEDLKDAADEATDEKDSDSDGDDDGEGNDVGGDPKVAKAAAKTSPASDATKPATALQNQKKEEHKK